MLKHLFLIMIVVFLSACSGSMTRIPESDKIISVRTELAGQTQRQILAATRLWMEENFTAQADPITLEDWGEGRIVGHGQIDYPCSWIVCLSKGDWKVDFSMWVEAQDGVLITTFRNIQLSSPPSGAAAGMNAPLWSQHDMDAIRPKLLEMNGDFVNELMANKGKP